MAPPLSREIVTDSSDFSESDDSQAQSKKIKSILKNKGKVETSSKARATTRAPPSESSQSSSEDSSSEEASSEDSDSSGPYEVPYGTVAINAWGDRIPTAKKPASPLRAEKPAKPPQAEKPDDKSSKDSDSTPKSGFVLPRGFKPINPTRSSEDVLDLFRNLGRKELWHISAPSDTTIDSIKQIPWNAMNTDRPVLTQNGVSYCFRSEPAPLITDEFMLLPAKNENVYYSYERMISRNFLLQEILDVPQQPPTIQRQNGKRKAPKNLRMRYRPYPSEDGPPIDLGSISESEAEEDTFKFPSGPDFKEGSKKESTKGNKKGAKLESKTEGRKESKKERKTKDRKESREEKNKEDKKAGKKESKAEVKEDKKGNKQEGKKRKHTAEVNEALADRGGRDGAELPRKKSKKQHTSHDQGKGESPHKNRSSSKPMDEREHARSKKSRKESERASEETNDGRKVRKEEKKQKKLEKKGKSKA